MGNGGKIYDFTSALSLTWPSTVSTILDILAIFLFLEFLGLFQHEFVEAGAESFPVCSPASCFASRNAVVRVGRLFGLALRFGTRRYEGPGLVRALFFFFLVARCFDLFRRCAKVALHFTFFFLRGSLAKDIFVLGICLRKIIEAKPLGEFQFASALRVALHQQVNTPFDFRGRTLPAATEKLIVFDLKLADVPFELAQLLFGMVPCVESRTSMLGAKRVASTGGARRHAFATAWLGTSRHQFEWAPARGLCSMLKCSDGCPSQTAVSNEQAELLRQIPSVDDYCCSRGWRFQVAWTAAWLWRGRAVLADLRAHRG